VEVDGYQLIQQLSWIQRFARTAETSCSATAANSHSAKVMKDLSPKLWMPLAPGAGSVKI